MLYKLFPIGENWSWGTFFLYLVVSMCVTGLCKKGAKHRALHTDGSFINIQVTKNRSFGSKLNGYYYVAIFFLVLLATLRTDQVGSDTLYYVSWFSSANAVSFDWSKLLNFNQQEPAYQLYSVFIRSFTDNYTVFFFITFSFVAWAYIRFIAYFFDNHSDYTFLQLFIFFYVSNMSGIRAACGTVFLLLAYIALDEKKYSKTIILTLVAALFHYTMLFNLYAIFMTWFMRTKALRKKKALWVLMVVATIILSNTSVYLLKGLFVSTKYDYYSSISIEDLSLLGSIFIIIYGILCAVYYKRFISKYSIKPKGESNFFSSVALLISYPLLYVIGAYRIPNYYALPRLYVWNEITNFVGDDFKNKGKHQIVFKVVVQVIVWLYLLFRFTRSAENGYFIYQWILG